MGRILRNEDNRQMIWNKYRPVVPFCNALFVHKRQVYVGRHIGGCHATVVVLWEKTNDEVEVRLVDRRIPKFQFLNTRKQGTV